MQCIGPLVGIGQLTPKFPNPIGLLHAQHMTKWGYRDPRCKRGRQSGCRFLHLFTHHFIADFRALVKLSSASEISRSLVLERALYLLE